MDNLLKQYKNYLTYLLNRNDIVKNDDYLKVITDNMDNNVSIKYIENKEQSNGDIKIKLLYDAITLYASENNIPVLHDIFDFGYIIKYNNNFYKIGVIYDLYNTYYCEKVDYNPEMKFIDFNDIINNKYEGKFILELNKK